MEFSNVNFKFNPEENLDPELIELSEFGTIFDFGELDIDLALMKKFIYFKDGGLTHEYKVIALVYWTYIAFKLAIEAYDDLDSESDTFEIDIEEINIALYKIISIIIMAQDIADISISWIDLNYFKSTMDISDSEYRFNNMYSLCKDAFHINEILKYTNYNIIPFSGFVKYFNTSDLINIGEEIDHARTLELLVEVKNFSSKVSQSKTVTSHEIEMLKDFLK